MTREKLLRELGKLARKTGKSFEVFKDKGNGSHYRVEFNGRITTVKSGELKPGYVQLIKKQLGIE